MLLPFQASTPIEERCRRLQEAIRIDLREAEWDDSGYYRDLANRGLVQLKELISINPSLLSIEYERFLEEVMYL